MQNKSNDFESESEKKPVKIHDWYENKDGRKFRGSRHLAKHMTKMGLRPCDPPTDERKTARADARKKAKALATKKMNAEIEAEVAAEIEAEKAEAKEKAKISAGKTAAETTPAPTKKAVV